MFNSVCILLTHDGDGDWLGDGVSFDVARLAGVAACLAPGHFLQHQAPVRHDNPVVQVVQNLLALCATKTFGGDQHRAREKMGKR